MFCIAGVAQLVEQLTCNQQVAGSSPITSSISLRMPAEGCPSGQWGRAVNPLTDVFEGSNPSPSTIQYSFRILVCVAGVAQLARALAFQAKGRGFESRLPLHWADFICAAMNWAALNCAAALFR